MCISNSYLRFRSSCIWGTSGNLGAGRKHFDQSNHVQVRKWVLKSRTKTSQKYYQKLTSELTLLFKRSPHPKAEPFSQTPSDQALGARLDQLVPLCRVQRLALLVCQDQAWDGGRDVGQSWNKGRLKRYLQMGTIICVVPSSHFYDKNPWLRSTSMVF